MTSQTTGRRLGFDTYQNTLDVTFFRLSRTDADVRANGITSQQQLNVELIAAGFDKPNRLYVVYYGGNMDGGFCGRGTYP
ncbi:MAG: hypothetical protein O2854_01535, partial [Chloroflexi bacterium]|nr:hypothetical protein [Chloroflexota bacterium]